mmetsp:Transcript_56185/g.130852  ORF Transcript_56185/g.130852 Transcript_56185/m.130852 type:complete len:718 (+) Transcript_56185:91-2244(+)|eukprot:CAMPEP_0171072082 /NCGR_PEP_ID=MMETSP0766_2-20121228/10656_1 /TAXON_ID=439317 /ORGANISM="Gambierdiscus australes, Strain CAWD 149" /LENGTH=717 /DNA_ID=CAMNT_0011528643 /DNA_START=90 /DNA_END=2243 /DNA_ORIENTATION=-
MGGCIGGVSSRPDKGQLNGLLSSSPHASPLTLRVNLKQASHADPEAQVVRSLAELIWIDAEMDICRVESACQASIQTLDAARVIDSQVILDFAVPVVNTVLHAPHERVRKVVWEMFVLKAVRGNGAMAHLFYWALKCVVTSPQAKAGTKEDAAMKLEEVRHTMSSQAQVGAALSRIFAANEALKRGAPLPMLNGIKPAPTTPLVELLERLHSIGEDIVKVKDKQARQCDLRKRLQEQVNACLVDSTPVPVHMLMPNKLGQPDPGSGASLLRLPVTEARVLSSKERAPYLVALEVEAQREGSQQHALTGLSRRMWCRRCASRAGPGLRKASKPRRSELASSKNVSSLSLTASPHAKPVPLLLSGASSPALLMSTDTGYEEEVEKYLNDKDQRPRGAFHQETWDEVVERVRMTSEFGERPGWGMLSLIVKSNADDVRQEELAYRLLKWFQRVFRRHSLKLWVHPFLIIATRHDGGCLETVTNAISLSELKKTYGQKWHSLRSYFEHSFHRVDTGDLGPNSPLSLTKALMNFIWSMASYSIVCYVLAIRDRHNGNILIDDEGHILHVDFGFMLCGAPGGKALQKMGGFEHSDGFKLTSEFVEVLGPTNERPFLIFLNAVVDGLVAVRTHADELLALLQLSMLGSENYMMNCFRHPRGYPEHVLEDVCARLGLPCGPASSTASAQTDEEFRKNVEQKVYASVDHWRSRLYDKYQYHFTGVH